jgi:2-polyprenyl-6-methoxyphenol hydroxylase-like FAD-dependent oxidoreductase
MMEYQAFMAIMNSDPKLRELAIHKAPGEDIEEQKQVMASYFQDCGWGESQRVIDGMMESDDFYYDMVAQVKMEKFSKGRVVLVGDAGYCASPLSGMGTTLALCGAYNLAGCILKHLSEGAEGGKGFDATFEEYEDSMRPLVNKAQRLTPGMPRLFFPETGWGLWVLCAIGWLFTNSGIMKLLFMFRVVGPPADAVPVKEYGFRKVEEWRGYLEEGEKGR